MKVTYKGKALIPSKYVEALDFQGKRIAVVIDSVHERVKLKGNGKDDGDESKPLFRLRGKEKGWVLNTTNLDSIAVVYGHESEKWIGKTVVLYGARVNAFGETKLAIRVDIDATQARADADKGGKGEPSKTEPTEPEHDADGVVTDTAQATQ